MHFGKQIDYNWLILVKRHRLQPVYIYKLRWLATDCTNREQEMTFLVQLGRNGGFQSNLYTPFCQIMYQFLHGGKMAPVHLLHTHYSLLSSPLPQENHNYLFWSDWYNAIKYICYQHAIQLCNFSLQPGMTNLIHLPFAFEQRCFGPTKATAKNAPISMSLT